MKLRNLLVATDFSPMGDRAFEVALAIARTTGASLTIAHVVPSPVAVYAALPVSVSLDLQEREAEGQKLDRLRMDALVARARRRGVKVSSALADGEAVAGILRIVKMSGPDVAVLGTHGRGGAAHLLLGGVAEKVVRRAPCPVLVVKQAKWKAKGPVLLALDTSPMARDVARKGAAIAAQLGRGLRVVHAIPDTRWVLGGAESAQTDKMLRKISRLGRNRAKNEIAGLLAKARVRIEKKDILIKEGRPQDVIVEAAKRTALTVVGTHGRRGMPRLFLGSVAEAVVRVAASPVLVLKEGK